MTHLITRRGVLAGGVLMALAIRSAFDDAATPPTPAAPSPKPLDLLSETAPDHVVPLLQDFDEYTW